MTPRRAVRLVLAVGALLGAGTAAACAQGDASAAHDVIRVSVGADIMFDPASGLYTYTYRVTNHTTSGREVWQFAVASGERVANVTGPPGWTSRLDIEHGIVHWAATTSEAPPEDVDDGPMPVRAARIKPGDTVTGFSFQSPDPPAPARFHASGAPSPPLPRADEGGGSEESDRDADGTTLAPRHAPIAPARRLTAYSTPRS